MISTKKFYSNKKIFICGGAGFIGHHLLDKLIQFNSQTTVGDNLSSGNIKNIFRIWKKNGLKYIKKDWGYQASNKHKFILLDFNDYNKTLRAFNDNEIVFHLAARFGGRGYIDSHPADCCDNFSIDQNIIKAASVVSVDRIQFASTACVYPFDLQKNYYSKYLLKESDAFKNNWANADREYGWAKLMGELTLKAFNKQYGLRGSITRYVTAYGPWENDTHAIIMLIRRAVEKKDPYLIWGSGKQDRDFTYVDDIVSGTLEACKKITNADAVNLGTGKRHSMVETINIIFDLLGWKPKKIIFDKTKPEGVKTRALNNYKAKKLLNWFPKCDFKTGLKKTIDWFIKEKPKSMETLK
ncbi:MAG: NAD-dependent epimerase/dehydratase [Candidatus Roizmanbacteria bacterium GW2011_GWC2_37_13]|uniref:NAD-dependent epimerase/dehydratase n=1 Tax=Candidatus Roizmanbacteria bacterium GW2011_GWC2_37_13 TaxID=1618486 RepID=A0A0G0G6I5_9BACT|nr:MAG: NAD-dependent epimerase/dehydratase [Candidatus Roizmanbacteria bacterium GW2011_GWC1_37_12]KKQ26713.1 MAG: NAD-dependent epimerase/dehydratase [Candidatus Roizmanbacteria bacterium GW2011_GWC2_37_13]